jgi:hypothetical protein
MMEAETESGRKSTRRFFCLVAVLVASFSALHGTARGRDSYKTLALEDRTTLQVGELAALPIPSDHRYRIVSAGNVLAIIRRSKYRAVFRAAHPGLETILLSPDVPNGECISCATHRYFITVVPHSDD